MLLPEFSQCKVRFAGFMFLASMGLLVATSAWRVEALAEPAKVHGLQIKTASPQVEITDEGRLRITLHFRVEDAQGNVVPNLPEQECVIYEDGQEVHRFRLQTSVRQDREVMLVLDTSGSMVGTPDRPLDRLDKAKEAATHFLQKLDPESACGLVLFHHEPYRIYQPRKGERSRQQLFAAITSAQGAGGTAYFDAALEAMRQLSDAPERMRAMVLLTDGRDVNSRHSLEKVVAEARRKGVSIYTIGLGKPGSNLHVRSLLILDRSGSMQEGNKIDHLRKAAKRYLELMPADHADCSLLPFNHHFDRPGDPSADKRSLMHQIDELKPDGGTALYDVTLFGLEWLAQKELAIAASPEGHRRECRRVIILLTDGMNEGGRVTDKGEFFRRLEQAHRQAQIPVYAIGLGDPRKGKKQEIDEEVLRRIAQVTGGRYYGVSNPAQLREVFEQLSIDIHDEGIDETALRSLAEQTGGRYFHAEQAAKLADLFSRALEQIEATFTVTYLSPRKRQDGTPSRIEIRLGTLRGQTGYATHWVITPIVDLRVFFTLLAILVVLGILPVLLRRKPSSSSAPQ
jgi:Mg-chelatase subunit ChlD